MGADFKAGIALCAKRRLPPNPGGGLGKGAPGTPADADSAGRAEPEGFRVMAVHAIEITGLHKNRAPIPRTIDETGTKNTVDRGPGSHRSFRSKIRAFRTAPRPRAVVFCRTWFPRDNLSISDRFTK